MKSLKTYLLFTSVLLMLSCVSKKEFQALEMQLEQLKQTTSPDFADDDDDGVFNTMDREPESMSGCPVDTKGIMLDSDGDGVLDCKDREPHSPPGFEINMEGVALIPIEPEEYNINIEREVSSIQAIDSDNGCTVVQTYFATDRHAIGDVNHPQVQFGGNRDIVKYGRCNVSIPDVHTTGNLEAPSIWRLEFREDPRKHVMYRETQVLDKEGFFQEMCSSETKKVLLFVHGYNVSFVDAAKRTAQMAYDLSFQGIPMFYSWPSQASLSGYMKDAQNIEYAQPNIEQFIVDIIEQMADYEIYIVAHSMGNRGVTKALASIFEKNPAHAKHINEIILTAPDIDAEIFKRDIAPSLVKHGNSVTLYASSTDKALIASKKVNGYQRAGDTGDRIVVVNGIETIDATNISTGFLGHSYFGETRSILNDIDALIDNGLKANNRTGLKKEGFGSKIYWKFKK